MTSRNRHLHLLRLLDEKRILLTFSPKQLAVFRMRVQGRPTGSFDFVDSDAESHLERITKQLRSNRSLSNNTLLKALKVRDPVYVDVHRQISRFRRFFHFALYGDVTAEVIVFAVI